MLFIDDSALAVDSSGLSLILDGSGTLMISAFGTTFIETDDIDAPGTPTVVIAAGDVTTVDYVSIRVGDATTPHFQMQHSGLWQTFTPSGLVIEGTYTLARKPTAAVPEPHAAMLFGVGSLVVATRLRRRPRD
jgi:hypothetical protein